MYEGPVKHSISLNGHRTSITLEREFYDALGSIAARERASIPVLVSDIDKARGDVNLSCAIRLFVLRKYTTSRNTVDSAHNSQ